MTLVKYAQNHRFSDPITGARVRQVQIFDDRDAKRLYATFAHWNSRKPRQNQKSVVINCVRWELIWLTEGANG
jgi:hypothetical protein